MKKFLLLSSILSTSFFIAAGFASNASAGSSSIIITSPKAGDNLIAGSAINIEWQTQNITSGDEFQVFYHLDGYEPYWNFKSAVPLTASSSYSYLLPVPSIIGKASILVGIGKDEYGQFIASATLENLNVVSTIILAADLKANNSDDPAGVSYDSTFTLSWTSTGTNYCAAYGHFVPLVEGGLWGDLSNLPTSGSKTLYARHQTYGYLSSLQLGIQCFNVVGNSVKDEVFVPVVQPSITVISPNGGETYKTGEALDIKWNSKNLYVDTVKIPLYYKHNDPTYGAGQYFEDLIIEKTANTGSYSWKIPEYYGAGIQNSSFMVKVEAAGVSDYSNGNFTIIPGIAKTDITVTSPAAGTVYYKGDVLPITWLSSGTEQYMVSLLRKNDPSFLRISLNFVGGYSPNVSYKIPADIPEADDYYIRVIEGDYRAKAGYSGAFSVKSAAVQPSVTLLSPNGGEQWTAGNSYNITWKSSSINKVDIHLISSTGDQSINLVYSFPASEGKFSFNPGAINAGSYKIKITEIRPPDTNRLAIFDTSDNYFSIVAAAAAAQPSITVLSPNGGERWINGNTYDITWKSTGVGNVMIEIEKGSTGWHLTYSVLSSLGKFVWKVEGVGTGDDYKINIWDTTNGKIIDSSDNYFSIAAQVVPSPSPIPSPSPSPTPPPPSSISYPNGALLRAENDFKIWVIHNEKKRWIRTGKILNSYGYKWEAIRVVSSETLKSIPINNLIRAVGDLKVYALNDNGYKRHIINPDIFNSYGLQWSDIAQGNQIELDSYSNSYLIRQDGDYKVYYIDDNKVRHWVKTIEAFYKNDFTWDAIHVINERDMVIYSFGADLE